MNKSMQNTIKLYILVLTIIGAINLLNNFSDGIHFPQTLSGIVLAANAQTEECVAGVGQCRVTTECSYCPTSTTICCVGYSCFANSGYVQCDGEATYCPGQYGIPCQ